jgi:hypothetical protein
MQVKAKTTAAEALLTRFKKPQRDFQSIAKSLCYRAESRASRLQGAAHRDALCQIKSVINPTYVGSAEGLINRSPNQRKA